MARAFLTTMIGMIVLAASVLLLMQNDGAQASVQTQSAGMAMLQSMTSPAHLQ